jgi:penicillin-binding protein 2
VSFGGPAGEKPQFVTVIEVDKANQGAISAAPFVRKMWDMIYGFGGQKALFPNGVPPKKLPKIRVVEALPRSHHPKASSTSTSTPSTGTSSPSTQSTGTASPPQSAAGLPPAIVPDRRRIGDP